MAPPLTISRDDEPMLRVETRFRNARLYNAIAERSVPLYVEPRLVTLHRRGPIKAFCDLHSLNLEIVYRLLNLRVGPLTQKKGRVRAICSRLSEILERPVEELFPAALYRVRWPELLVKEIDAEPFLQLVPPADLALPPTQDDDVVHTELKASLAHALSTLTPIQQTVIKMRYGLDDGEEHTYDEIAHAIDRSKARVSQIEAKALRLLRQPSRNKRLKPFLE